MRCDLRGRHETPVDAAPANGALLCAEERAVPYLGGRGAHNRKLCTIYSIVIYLCRRPAHGALLCVEERAVPHLGGRGTNNKKLCTIYCIVIYLCRRPACTGGMHPSWCHDVHCAMKPVYPRGRMDFLVSASTVQEPGHSVLFLWCRVVAADILLTDVRHSRIRIRRY